MSLIQVKNLTFAYEGSYDNIFEDVSFQIDTDWRLGFTGRNGRGKTTFLQLLMGKHPYKGTISASVSFDYFPFEVQDEWDSTIDVAQAVCGAELWQVKKELNLLEVQEDVLYRPFGTLSHGERTKVLLAALFLKPGNFLLIDEPTNHIDTHARGVVSRYLNSKKGFILVSHDRVFLDGCIDHVLSINKTNIEVQKGNFSSWQANKELQDGYELAENEKLKKDIKRMEAAARRTADWSDKIEKTKKGQRVAGLKPDRGHIGAQAAKMMKKSKVAESRRERAAEDKSKLLKNVEQADELFLQPMQFHSDGIVEAHHLSVAYEGRAVFEGLDFTIKQGERVVLAGKNGSGKSSIIKLLAGEEIPHTGTLRTAAGVVISYVPQDTSFLRGSLDEFARQKDLDKSLFLAILRKLDFERVQFEKEMEDYSEGQKKKVLLAMSLCQPAHLYLWDEPLNFIDVLSRMQIEQAILNSAPTMLFVEHDMAFARDIATREIELLG
ncbi:ABC-F type ribosomal protection protein [Christensenellaceae bacterium OttesenSCG-928-K19]|nr:ABC-F type ribosomal protection protein [Christensenellaceae bacterium OttesenSCG-928-K19]